jgi:hypothetical protein
MRIIVLIFFIFAASCVTVNVGEDAPKKSSHIQFITPEKPFEEHQLLNADKAWVSKTTGNVISFTSECPKNSDPSLELLTKETLQSLDHVEVIDKKSFSFNGREATKTSAKGSIDGVPLSLNAVVFKKNNCNYRIIYSGLRNQINAEEKYFEDFLKDFKAP